MNPSLLELLVDPAAGGPLAIDNGSLIAADGTRYAIRDGIARLADPATSGQEDTFDTFSWKWTHVSDEEIDQRVVAQYAWYDERYGFDGDDGLAALLDGRSTILEAGTGIGGDAARFARLAPHAEVVAIDLSKAIEVAKRRFGGPPNLHYVQADIMNLPFAPGTFDFISAEQVIHHTPAASRPVASSRRTCTASRRRCASSPTTGSANARRSWSPRTRWTSVATSQSSGASCSASAAR